MVKVKILILSLFILSIGLIAYVLAANKSSDIAPSSLETDVADSQNEDDGGITEDSHPLSIESLKKGNYPGSEIVIEKTLDTGSNYKRYLASYKSDGLKIFALLTIPVGERPKDGWPAIIFNHGYIPPAEYQTTEKYVAYVDGFAKEGYIVFKSDFRGHGDSEGDASGAYGSSAYSVDVLNAVSSIRKYKDVDPAKIGMWGHSMGGYITLRNMVVSSDIKAGVIWAGVVASYPDMLTNWRRGRPTPSPLPGGTRRWRQQLTEQFGTPEQNPEFWNSISATSFLSEISGPIQLHHGTADISVPLEFSKNLDKLLNAVGKESELFVYEGDDHNLSDNLSLALLRSVEFFDKYLK